VTQIMISSPIYGPDQNSSRAPFPTTLPTQHISAMDWHPKIFLSHTNNEVLRVARIGSFNFEQSQVSYVGKDRCSDGQEPCLFRILCLGITQKSIEHFRHGKPGNIGTQLVVIPQVRRVKTTLVSDSLHLIRADDIDIFTNINLLDYSTCVSPGS
jgi:hypothetical protein